MACSLSVVKRVMKVRRVCRSVLLAVVSKATSVWAVVVVLVNTVVVLLMCCWNFVVKRGWK